MIRQVNEVGESRRREREAKEQDNGDINVYFRKHRIPENTRKDVLLVLTFEFREPLFNLRAELICLSLPFALAVGLLLFALPLATRYSGT
jgi:hypothetical protein